MENWLSKLWTAGASSRIKAVQQIKDDGTSADEVLKVTKWLLPILVILCTGFTYVFFQQIFQEYLPEMAASMAAMVIALTIEIMKTFMGIRCIRYVYFANPIRSVADSVLFVGIFLASIGAFAFSYRNSTMGLEEYSTTRVKDEGQKDITFTPNTTEIDAQIAEARAAQKAALANRWKGTTTVEGQRMARQAEKNIESLNAQRQKMIDQAQIEYDRQIATLDTKALRTATWSRIAGGIVEIAQIIMLLIAGSCERILATRNPSAGYARQISPHNSNGRPNTSNPSSGGSNSNLHFFNRAPGGNVVSTSLSTPAAPVEVDLTPTPPPASVALQPISPTVPPPPAVSQSDTEDADQTPVVVGELSHSLKSLQAETSNLINRNGNPKSIAIRILKILLAIKTVLKEGSEHDFKVLDRLQRYVVEKTFQTLDKNQMPYKYETEFLNLLDSRLREAEAKHYA